MLHEHGGIRLVTELLQKLGMSADRGREVQLLLETVAALTSGKPVAASLKRLGVQLPHNYVITANKLSQLLYAYLVHWLGKVSSILHPLFRVGVTSLLVLWMNSVCESNGGLPVASISLLSSPGLCGNKHRQRRQLPSLLMSYADQFVLNIYCSRQFVWEQVIN